MFYGILYLLCRTQLPGRLERSRSDESGVAKVVEKVEALTVKKQN